MKTENKPARSKETKSRSIHLPIWLWDLLDEDAERCGRSATKQLEALLTLCYDPSINLEIDKESLALAFQIVSHKRKAA